MPLPATNAQLDGISVVTKGMHSGIDPGLIPPDQVAMAVNLTFRGGLPHTRPVWKRVDLQYESEDTETYATERLFQCASFYQAYGQTENCLVASIGGRLFRFLVGSTNVVQDISVVITPADPNLPKIEDLNNANKLEAWMWQSEDFLIVQNGQANPLFFDGASTRRSGGMAKNELPPGCMGAYVQGRNWMVLPNQQSFMAGDLVYSAGFQDGYEGRAAVLKTTENTFLSGGGAFGVPVTAGKINAMSSVAIADTSLGQGPLQVMTQNSVFSVQVPFLREEWADTQYPLMTIGLPNYGAVSQTSVVPVNGDLWYRATDGLRSYQIGRRDLGTWVNTPLSVEVEKIIALDTKHLLNKVSGALFNNRLFETCVPYWVNNRGVAFRGLVALDFNNISNLTSRSAPAYDGLWTSFPILQIVKGVFHGVERCFAFGMDCNCKIRLWELLPDDEGYFDYNGNDYVGVESILETRTMSWKDEGNVLKKLLCADLYLEKLAGTPTLNFEIQYRSDQDPIWKDWHSFSLCAPVQDCTLGCPPFSPVRDQYRTFLRMPEPADTCSQMTKRMSRTGYEFQFRLKGTGHWMLNHMHTWALPMGDSVVRACPTSETCVLLKGCDEPWFDYSSDGCAGLNQPVVTPEGEDPVVTPTGACCIAGVCSIKTEVECIALGGEYAGDGTTCASNPCPTNPKFNIPAWPVPTPYDCVGSTVSLPILVTDTVTGVDAYVGISPGALDPVTYLAGYPGALEAWAAEVWNQWTNSGIAYSQARLIWQEVHTGGLGWQAHEVFPSQAGDYHGVINLDMKVVVEYCPL